jgi:hypothetical protein
VKNSRVTHYYEGYTYSGELIKVCRTVDNVWFYKLPTTSWIILTGLTNDSVSLNLSSLRTPSFHIMRTRVPDKLKPPLLTDKNIKHALYISMLYSKIENKQITRIADQNID